MLMNSLILPCSLPSWSNWNKTVEQSFEDTVSNTSEVTVLQGFNKNGVCVLNWCPVNSGLFSHKQDSEIQESEDENGTIHYYF